MTHGRIPRFVKVIAAGVVVGLILTLVAAREISNLREAEERRDCERAAATRMDLRTMWLWLGDQYPESAAEISLKAELDRLLPVLHCDHGIPTPVEE